MSSPKIIAVIPVFGREVLLPFTIKRLIKTNKLFKVICCGNRECDKTVCLNSGADWVQVENNPLGNKWNKGFEYSKQFDPDGILFVGSSDWISRNWISHAWNYIKNENFDMVGKKDFYMVDISINGKIKYCKWLGYPGKNRENEPIGIGRLISKKFLKAINYTPFEKNANNSMDYFMYKKCLNKGLKVKLVEDNKYKFLSISTNRWINKHKFYRHYIGALVIKKPKIIDMVYQYLLLNIIKCYKNKDELFFFYLNFAITLKYIKGDIKETKINIGVYNDKTLLLNSNEISEINNEFTEIEEFSNKINKEIDIEKFSNTIRKNRVIEEIGYFKKNKLIFVGLEKYMSKIKTTDVLDKAIESILRNKFNIGNTVLRFLFRHTLYFIDDVIVTCEEKEIEKNNVTAYKVIDLAINNLGIMSEFKLNKREMFPEFYRKVENSYRNIGNMHVFPTNS